MQREHRTPKGQVSYKAVSNIKSHANKISVSSFIFILFAANSFNFGILTENRYWRNAVRLGDV